MITYNEIPTFIMDLLNHQAMIINTMVPVMSKLLQSTLNSNATPWFPPQPHNIPIPDTSLESKNEESINNEKDALQNENNNTVVQSIARETNL